MEYHYFFTGKSSINGHVQEFKNYNSYVKLPEGHKHMYIYILYVYIYIGHLYISQISVYTYLRYIHIYIDIIYIYTSISLLWDTNTRHLSAKPRLCWATALRIDST